MSWPKPIGSVNCKNKQGKILRTAFKESRLVTRGPSHAPSREAPLLLAIERGFSKRILLLPFALPLPAHELEEKRKEIHCGDTSTAERGLPIPFPSLPFPSLPFPSLLPPFPFFSPSVPRRQRMLRLLLPSIATAFSAPKPLARTHVTKVTIANRILLEFSQSLSQQMLTSRKRVCTWSQEQADAILT